MTTIESEDNLLPCPDCGQPTDSLKQYRYVQWCIFLLAGAIWWAVDHRACPACMRRFLWRRCLLNVVPANFLWLGGLLPWALILTAVSFRRGHSRAVLRIAPSPTTASSPPGGSRTMVEGGTPPIVMQGVITKEEFSFANVAAVLAVLLCWLPILGLIAALLAWLLSRGQTGWVLRASQFSVIVSALVHLALGVMILVEVMKQ